MPTFEVFRYDPRGLEIENDAFFQEYEVPDAKGLTVLEGLYYILENLDPTLAFRSSCRQGECGS